MARRMGRLGPRLGVAWPLAGQRPLQLSPAVGAPRLALRARLVLARVRRAWLGRVGRVPLGRPALGVLGLVVLKGPPFSSLHCSRVLALPMLACWLVLGEVPYYR